MADQVDMLTRFINSAKPRPAAARQIPGQHVQFFDRNGQFQKGGFQLLETPKEPSQFTNAALNWFDTEYAHMVVPDNFIPTDIGINLQRWTSTTPYTVPGAAGFGK
jgi:hypothetical protein